MQITSKLQTENWIADLCAGDQGPAESVGHAQIMAARESRNGVGRQSDLPSVWATKN